MARPPFRTQALVPLTRASAAAAHCVSLIIAPARDRCALYVPMLIDVVGRPLLERPHYGLPLIMRCAYGVPAYMIQVPVFFGVVGRPLLFSTGHMIIQCGGS
jgi:hypothetical protein